MNKRIGWLAASIFLTSLQIADAQQPRLPMVGRLSSGFSNDPLQKAGFGAFLNGIRELGWSESKISIEGHWIGDNPTKARELAADFVRRKQM